MAPKRKSVSASDGRGASSAAVPKTASTNVDWPAIEPLRNREDLFLEEPLPGQIFTINGLWTSTLCKKYISFLSKLPLTTTPGKPRKGEAVRVNDRFQIDDPSFARALWEQTALKSLINDYGEFETEIDGTRDIKQPWGGEVLGLNPNIRIYRYRKGQFFGKHYDESNNLTITGTSDVLAKTTWTLLLYISSCEGGETSFYPEALRGQRPQAPLSFSPEVGLALLHRHGVDCMLHEGHEVLEGEKWVLRSDLCVRR